MFYVICAWINGRANNREAGDLRRYRAQYDVTVMDLHNTGCPFVCICVQGGWGCGVPMTTGGFPSQITSNSRLWSVCCLFSAWPSYWTDRRFTGESRHQFNIYSWMEALIFIVLEAHVMRDDLSLHRHRMTSPLIRHTIECFDYCRILFFSITNWLRHMMGDMQLR